MAAQAPLKKVTVLDLTVGDVEKLELEIGLPANKWLTEAPSLAALYAKVYAAGAGIAEDEARKIPMRQLLAAVELGEGDDAEDAEVDPTPSESAA